jgi:hypothetical protein
VSSRYGRLREVFPVAPGCGLVVEGAGLQASAGGRAVRRRLGRALMRRQVAAAASSYSRRSLPHFVPALRTTFRELMAG